MIYGLLAETLLTKFMLLSHFVVKDEVPKSALAVIIFHFDLGPIIIQLQ
jgi:hypothetical protein